MPAQTALLRLLIAAAVASLVLTGCPGLSPECDDGACSLLDGGAADAGVADAGAFDAGADAGATDAGEVDAGELDAGELDAGELDAGELDAGELDAGEVDAGEFDAGAPDAGPPCDPVDPLDGGLISAPDNTWTWVGVTGAVCRNGSAAGFGVRTNPASDRLMIFLSGGGLCFNGVSCTGNVSSFSSANFDSWKTTSGTTGVFDNTNAANPLRDWNIVYVPLCTGDGHMGHQTGVNVPGTGSPQNQAFVGAKNLGLMLSRIVPSFPGVTRVLLAGESTGAIGVLTNADRVARDFCGAEVTLLNDSFPVMADAYLAPCLQQRFRTLWGFDGELSSWCPAATSSANGGGLIALNDCVTGVNAGLIASTQDSAMSTFFGFGQNDCANLDGFAAALPAATYAAGLDDLRTNHLATNAAWSTWVVSGTGHTFLSKSTFTTTTTSSVPLATWVEALADGGTAWNVGP